MSSQRNRKEKTWRNSTSLSGARRRASAKPWTLQKRFSKYGGQFFAYTQQLISKSKERSLAPTLYHDLELSGKKVCFQPTQPKYSLGFISQALGRNAFRRVDKTYGIQFGTKYVELYLYNESTGMADIKTDLTLPSWIVYKTLALLNDRWKNTNADLAKRLEEEIGSYKQEQVSWRHRSSRVSFILYIIYNILYIKYRI